MNDSKIVSVLRVIIGLVAITLPIFTILFGLFGDNSDKWYYSISATFYANSGPIMVGSLCTCAAFFFAYGLVNPYRYWIDAAIAISVAVCFLGIAFFPCSNTDLKYVSIIYCPVAVSSMFHNLFAAFGFILLAIMVGFCFTKTTNAPTEQKKKRNVVYVTCAISIVVFMLCFAISSLVGLSETGPYVMVFETLILWAVGVAWFTKAGYLFKDKA
jgi:hypothetical protein